MKRTLSKLVCLSFLFSASVPSVSALAWGEAPPSNAQTQSSAKDGMEATAAGGAKGSALASSKGKSKKKDEQPARSVEMFQAMKDGLLTVDYIGKDATEASVIFKNKTTPVSPIGRGRDRKYPVNRRLADALMTMG